MAADYVADGIDVKPMATGVRLVATSTDSQRNAAIYFLPPIENQMITFRATIAQTGVNNGCCQLAWMDRGNRMIGQPLMSETATTNRRVFTVGEKPVWDARLCLLLYINYDAS